MARVAIRGCLQLIGFHTEGLTASDNRFKKRFKWTAFGEDVHILYRHCHILVVAKDRLKLIGLEQHRGIAQEIVVERSSYHGALGSNERKGDDNCKQRTHNKLMAQNPVR